MSIRSPHWLNYDIRELTISQVMARQAAAHGDALFMHDLDIAERHTYAQVKARVDRLAAGFRLRGIRQGTRVGVMMDTHPTHVMVLFALGQIGAVGALINTAARGDLLQHYLSLAEVTHLVADEAYVDRLVDACRELPAVGEMIVECATAPEPIKQAPMVQTRLAALADCQPDSASPEPVPSFSDLGFIMFTSGTTGPSKGVMYTQARALMYGMDMLTAFGIRSNDVMFCWMPMAHLSGLQCAVLTALLTGASLAMTRRFSASGVMDAVRDSGATVLQLPGASLNMLWAREASPQDRQHHVRVCATVPIPSFAPAFERRFGFRLVSAYGLTDCGMATAFGLSDPEAKLGSAGRARDGWSVRVVDQDDFDQRSGETGEILLRCDRPWGHSSGYYRDPQATVEAWRGGWFHTGDRGFLDADGYLWYVGRSKDCIRRRGENISAFEVENSLMLHPAVAEAAAFPMACEMGDEEVAVAVLLREGQRVDEAELVRYCIDRMPHYMVPRYLMLLDELPRTPSQKVQKFKLIAQARELGSALWDRQAAGIEVRRS